MTASSDPFEAVHARLLRFYPELVRDLGGDPVLLLQQAGLDSADAGIGYRQLVLLLEHSALALGRPDFGLRLALRQRGGAMFGPLGQAMRNSPTLGDALDYASRHSYAHSLAARLWLRRFPSVRHVFVGHDILLDAMPDRAQAMEQILLLGHLTAMDLTGSRARARRVHFRHQPLSPVPLYRRHFGCPVHFGQSEDGISFADRDMACPIVASDADALSAVTAYIRAHFPDHHPPLHAQVRGLIKQGLGVGDCSNAQVAENLGLHPRTLHRRLGAEGTAFQTIKDEVRRDMLLYYLRQTDLDVMVISEKLGFAEQSVLTRSCHSWLGAAPTAIRVAARG